MDNREYTRVFQNELSKIGLSKKDVDISEFEEYSTDVIEYVINKAVSFQKKKGLICCR